MRNSSLLATCIALLYSTDAALAYEFTDWWRDDSDIVMDVIFAPAETFDAPAQLQMSEWNEVDTSDNSHPFRVAFNPQNSFGASDGDNTMGFLSGSAMMSEYGYDYSDVNGQSALAVTQCWRNSATGMLAECDVMLDPNRDWSTDPDDEYWFESTVLHELGHVRGLLHENDVVSIMNSGESKLLRDEVLYRDDRQGVRQFATTVPERDVTIQNKWHDGSQPQWMTMGPTLVREGDTVTLNNIYVESRGDLGFPGNLDFVILLSKDPTITTSDRIVSRGSWQNFSTFTTFDWEFQVPEHVTCRHRWVGGIVDSDRAWAERFEHNNAVVFTDGNPYGIEPNVGSTYAPQPIYINLAEDVYEQNDTLATAATIPVPYPRTKLTIDQDVEKDYYRIVVTNAAPYIIEADFDNLGGSVSLFLYDESGATIDGRFSFSTDATLTMTHELQPGTYYVAASGGLGGFTGTGSGCSKYYLEIRDGTDLEPPSPNPMTFASNLAGASTSEVEMTASFATDASGPVEYYFEHMSSPTGGSGGSDSAWMTGPSYVTYYDAGLEPNHEYCYRVTARDAYANETDPSTTMCAHTLANPPALESFADVSGNSITVNLALNGNAPGTEVYIRNIETNETVGWTTDLAWTNSGLECETSYTYEAQTRNGDGDFDPPVEIGNQTTASCQQGSDTDGDSVPDASDNCSAVANDDQRDTDGDGIGNMCDPDFNGNGVVDPADFSLLKSRFGQSGFPDQDLNGNGVVDPFDFSLLKSMFGQPPGPSGLTP